MEDWTRVVLYGTYDGFVRSTNESLQIAVRLEGGERVEIPSECVISADQIVKKDEIKLKDVIKRIKYFDLVTQAVWVNGILNELGSGFGLHKYCEGYKQGKLEGAMEREKVQVPQFVADYIEYTKVNEWDLLEAMDDVVYEDDKDLRKWFNSNMQNFALAWINGYTVEEKRYLVKVKNVLTNQGTLNRSKRSGEFIFSNPEENSLYNTKFNRKELEEAGFGEVFNSPLFQVEEVE